jgi:tRNA (guanine37-N1)-methyltransferase
VSKFVRPFCEDGRAFIRASTKRMREWHDTEKEVEVPLKVWDAKKKKGLPTSHVFTIPPVVNHFVMNLPASAIEFLGTYLSTVELMIDAFRGLYHGAEDLFAPNTETPLPIIHVYCFENPELASDALLEAVRKALGYEIPKDDLTIHDVRNVAPKKVLTATGRS